MLRPIAGFAYATRPHAFTQPRRNCDAFEQEGDDATNLPQVAALNDSITLANIARMLRSERKQFWVRSELNANLEILLSVNVIDNQPGPPRVIASVVW